MEFQKQLDLALRVRDFNSSTESNREVTHWVWMPPRVFPAATEQNYP